MEIKSIKDIKLKTHPSSFIELYGNSEAVIDGCKGVSDYSESFIKLDLGQKKVKISGDALTVSSYIYESASVKGNIVSVEFTDD